ncbi:MAG: hypothetical protein GC191_14550 [Azospirillum sp.]|nr:hypothetical protein [Azospirillum sp.]
MKRKTGFCPGTAALGKSARAIALALLGLTAAGCGSTPAKDKAVETADGCPKVSILRDAAQITLFRAGPGRDLTDVAARGALVDFHGKCEIEDDGAAINFDLALVAEKGPALSGNRVNFEYFVAIVGPARQQLKKETFSTTVEFASNESRSGSKEELYQKIPLVGGQSAAAYQILVGFQLSPEQLAFNRKALAGR